jgi:hypothetical protein
MSINPLAFRSVSYIGTPFRQPTMLCTPLNDAPACVPLSFNWASYGVSLANPDVAVPINLISNSAVRELLKTIRGVYIDNTGSNASIYIYFPDTKMTVTCAPFSTTFQPVITNVLECTIVGRGFTTNDTSQTNVFLLNTPVDPGFNQEIQNVYPQFRASPTVSRGSNIYTAGFAIPAIGDQWSLQRLFAITGTQSIGGLFGTPYQNGGVITLTDLQIAGIWNGGGVSNGTTTVRLYTQGASGNFFLTQFSSNNPVFAPFINFHGSQFKLNASENWIFEITSNSNNPNIEVNFHAGFSYQGPPSAQYVSVGVLTQPSVTSPGLNTGAARYGGFSFIAPVTGVVQSAAIVNDFASDSGSVNMVAELRLDAGGGNPGALVATSSPTFCPNTAGVQSTFIFPTSAPITVNNRYWIVMRNDGASLHRFIAVSGVGLTQFQSGIGASPTSLGAISPSLLWKMGVNCYSPL